MNMSCGSVRMRTTRFRRVGVALSVLLGTAASASGQAVTVADPFEDYLRVLELVGAVEVGSFTVRPLAPRDEGYVAAGAEHPWASWLEVDSAGSDGIRLDMDAPRFRSFANSKFPVGINDGPVWQGRGLTSSLDAGATLRWRGLTATLHPTLLFNENRSFELAAAPSTYAYPWWTIDLPQRYGPDPYWTVDPGESEIRLDGMGLSLGFGSRSLWWGPGLRNAIVMSNNAPGIPHAFVGSDGPVGIGVGTLEARWIWGDLDESGWFEEPVESHDRFITGIVLAYSPSFVTGLSVGMTRVFMRLVPESGVPMGDYFSVFQGFRKKSLVTAGNPDGSDESDQILSLFGRWVLPESGFEVFFEWARTDHSWEVRDFLLEPEYSQASTIGLQKAFSLQGNRILTFWTELTHLAKNSTAFVRPGGNPVYYIHNLVKQGYTQKGQIIGAGIGPGGNAQGIGLELYAPWGRWEAYLQREVKDNDAYYEWSTANGRGACCHDVMYHLGGQALFFVGDFDLGGGFVITREFQRYFYGLDLWNLNLSFSARWRPDGLTFP
jgi:hypothetical protein